MKALTVKRISARGPRAESPAIKLERVKFVSQLNSFELNGWVPVYVDETHLEIGNVSGYGRSPAGEKCIVAASLRPRVVSTIASLTMNGPRHALVVDGTVDGKTFQAYVQHLLAEIVQRDRPGHIVLVLDNASIHKRPEMISSVEATGHKILFNAPYSPELNTIEIMFGIWKKRAKNEIRNWADDSDLLRQLTGVFTSIHPETARKLCNHPRKEVWERVFAHQDL